MNHTNQHKNMAKKIRLKPGDIIEIPLGDGYLGYARIYEDLGYRPYCICATVRPSIEDIKASGGLEVLEVGEYQSETGAWPKIGRDPFIEGEDRWPETVVEGAFVRHHGESRVATEEELMQFPIAKRFGESSFINYIREKVCSLPPLATDTPIYVDPLKAAMSVDDNDVAQQVTIQFEEFLERGISMSRAYSKTIRHFADCFADEDWEPSLWLSLASIGLKHACITDEVRAKALEVIESGRCWDAPESIEAGSRRNFAYSCRQQAIAELRRAISKD